ncbi:MAG: LamG domain-containing protein [Planctomycetota bacterium]|jgi:hypothetical protein
MMDDGGVEFYIEGGDNDANPEGSVVNDDSWHHITATWDINADAKLYIDGGEPVSVPHDANEFNLSGTIRLGRPAGGERFYNGLIDDVRLYNYVLSADEIAAIMRGDVTLAWKFISALIEKQLPTLMNPILQVSIGEDKVLQVIPRRKVLNGVRLTTGGLTSITRMQL